MMYLNVCTFLLYFSQLYTENLDVIIITSRFSVYNWEKYSKKVHSNEAPKVRTLSAIKTNIISFQKNKQSVSYLNEPLL